MSALSRLMKPGGHASVSGSSFDRDGPGQPPRYVASHDDMPIGGGHSSNKGVPVLGGGAGRIGASPRYTPHDEAPVGRTGASPRYNPHEDMPVGRAGLPSSSRSKLTSLHDDVPVGRSGSISGRRDLDDVPVGRSGSISGRKNLDDVPVGLSGSISGRRDLDDVPVGRPGSISGRRDFDDVPVGRSGSGRSGAISGRKDLGDAPVGRSRSISSRKNLDDIPVGRSGTASSNHNSYDDVPIGRKAAKENGIGRSADSRISERDKRLHEEIPIARKAGSDERGKRGKLTSHDDVPVGRKSALTDDKRDRGRSGSSPRSSPYDDIPVGRKVAMDDLDRGTLADRGRSGASPRLASQREDLSVGRGDHGGKRTADLGRSSSSKVASHDDVPIGGRRSAANGEDSRKSGNLAKLHSSPRMSSRDDLSGRRRNDLDDTDRFGSTTLRSGGRDDLPRRRDRLEMEDDRGLGSIRRRRDLADDDFSRRGTGSTSFERRDELPSRRRERRDLDDDARHQQQVDQRRRQAKLRQPLPANLSGSRYDAVHHVTKRIGFLPSADDDFKTPFLIWIDSFISAERLSELRPHQRVNHFPGMAEICRKDLLARNLAKAAKLHPKEYNFAPRTWCLPAELQQFQQRSKELQKAEKRRSFISKPVDGAMGQGIEVYKSAEDVPTTPEEWGGERVLQEYVSNPFLLDGLKFDLRLYVLVTSCDPLSVYFYNDGLLRMSSEPYVEPLKTKSDSVLMHVTNAPPLPDHQSDDRRGHRARPAVDNVRPLRLLNDYLVKRDYDVAQMWRSILDLILRTVFLAYPHVLRSYRRCRPADPPGRGSVCFELLGFDILLDAKLRPWLMEVNRSPGLNVDHPVERELKLGLLEETLLLLNFRPSDRKRAAAVADKSRASSTDLGSLLARLQCQAASKEVETRVCQRFRRIFPADDPGRQESLVAAMLAVFPAVLEAGTSTTALLKELEAFYANKLSLEEVAKRVADEPGRQQRLECDTSSSEDHTEEDGSPSRQGKKKKASKRNKQRQSGATDSPDHSTTDGRQTSGADPEQHARFALECLNTLRIRCPGKADSETERLLAGLRASWQASKHLVGSYWRLGLDAGKRAKVLDIARRSVHVALEKTYRAADVDRARLPRLLGRLFNRLLWRNGQGLWETFSGRASWEAILSQASQGGLSQSELLCCRRVVQLCQDCLLVVYLYSGGAPSPPSSSSDSKKAAAVTVSASAGQLLLGI